MIAPEINKVNFTFSTKPIIRAFWETFKVPRKIWYSTRSTVKWKKNELFRFRDLPGLWLNFCETQCTILILKPLFLFGKNMFFLSTYWKIRSYVPSWMLLKFQMPIKENYTINKHNLGQFLNEYDHLYI